MYLSRHRSWNTTVRVVIKSIGFGIQQCRVSVAVLSKTRGLTRGFNCLFHKAGVLALTT